MRSESWQNMNDYVKIAIEVVSLLLGSGLIQFFVSRHDTRHDTNKQIESKLDKLLSEQKKSEKDNLRTQLLVMMNLMPNNSEEIMTCAERYFGELKGDWFYSSLFNKWLKENEIEKPIWFDQK